MKEGRKGEENFFFQCIPTGAIEEAFPPAPHRYQIRLDKNCFERLILTGKWNQMLCPFPER